MSLHFIKMHSLGNDFMIVDGVTTPVQLSLAQIRRLADRHRGVGFDQCLVLEKPIKQDPSSHKTGLGMTEGVADDFSVRIYNADGKEVGQCGNGLRCLARFIAHLKLSAKKTLCVSTQTSRLILVLQEDGTVTVKFPPLKVPPKVVSLQSHTLQVLDVGNPHAVIKVDDVEACDVAGMGRCISEDPFFPEQTNVAFLALAGVNQIKLRVYERGCGETQACGSGAVAAAIVAHRTYHVALPMTVMLPGGCLQIEDCDETGVSLRGEAVLVYEGSILSPLS